MYRDDTGDDDYEGASKRSPPDKLVSCKQNGAASAHVTENGYVMHRLLEINERMKVA